MHLVSTINQAYLNDTSPLVPKHHVDLLEVLICAAYPGMGDFDQNLIWFDSFLGDGLDDLAFLGTLKDRELDHLDRFWSGRELRLRDDWVESAVKQIFPLVSELVLRI